MTLPESAPPSGPAPCVSVLVTTYNRSGVLPRAIESILMQDFADFEVVVVDDQSADDTPQVMAKYTDPRIRYIRNVENMARKGGDRSIFQRFVNEQARGEFFLWLCDDDYWLPKDLLARQIRIMRDHSSVAMVFGGMAQLYPTLVPLPIPNEPYLTYEYVGGADNVTFARNVYPNGFLSSEIFLDLFAEDPKNRNNVTGGTMFRATSFRRANAFAHGGQVRWQSGYLMLAGTATMGDVWYLDEPCVVATVELSSASYRGTQLDHMRDCLRSIDAAFRTSLDETDSNRGARMAFIRVKMMHSIFQTYLANKISYRLGGFRSNPLARIEKIFETEIKCAEFYESLDFFGVPRSWQNKMAIALSAFPASALRILDGGLRRVFGISPLWWKNLMKFPSDIAESLVASGPTTTTLAPHA